MSLEQQSGAWLGVLSCQGVTHLLWHSWAVLLPARPALEGRWPHKNSREPLRCHFSSCSVEWEPDEKVEKSWPLSGPWRGGQLPSASPEWDEHWIKLFFLFHQFPISSIAAEKSCWTVPVSIQPRAPGSCFLFKKLGSGQWGFTNQQVQSFSWAR